jgi:hypothetical protein
MEIEFDDLRPHVTLSLFRSADTSLIVKEVHAQLSKLCETLPRRPAKDAKGQCKIHNIDGNVPDDLFVKAAWYEVEQAPSWLGAEARVDDEPNARQTQAIITDRRNHLVIGAVIRWVRHYLREPRGHAVPPQ